MAKRIGKYKVSNKESALSLADGGVINGSITCTGDLTLDATNGGTVAGSKVEVKTERDIWKTTGNIAIELRCNGKPSGISTTESSVWVHLLAHKGVIKGGFLFKVDELKGKIKKLHENGKLKMVMGGDDNASQMALLPIKELFD